MALATIPAPTSDTTTAPEWDEALRSCPQWTEAIYKTSRTHQHKPKAAQHHRPCATRRDVEASSRSVESPFALHLMLLRCFLDGSDEGVVPRVRSFGDVVVQTIEIALGLALPRGSRRSQTGPRFSDVTSQSTARPVATGGVVPRRDRRVRPCRAPNGRGSGQTGRHARHVGTQPESQAVPDLDPQSPDPWWSSHTERRL